MVVKTMMRKRSTRSKLKWSLKLNLIFMQVPIEEDQNEVDQVQPKQYLQQNDEKESSEFSSPFKKNEAWE